MGYWNIHKLLKDETRRKVIQFIGTSDHITYTDILRELGVSTGKLNYHLRLLSPLITKPDNEQYYSLSDLGRNVFALLQGFKQEEQASGNQQLLNTGSWVLLPLSLLAMYYGFFGGPDTRAALGFVSTALLIVAVAAMYYSRRPLDLRLRHVVVFSLAAAAFAAPVGLEVTSNPLEGSPVIGFSAPVVNSPIFYPTLLTWSLANKGRKEWTISSAIIGGASAVTIALFLVAVALSPAGLASLTSTVTSCRIQVCYIARTSSYVSAQPAFLLLTVFSNRVVSNSRFRKH